MCLKTTCTCVLFLFPTLSTFRVVYPPSYCYTESIMNANAKIILGVLAALLVFIVGLKYVEYFVQEDFMVFAYVNCDPETEACFQYDCADWCEDAGPWKFYEGDPYKKLRLSSNNAPACLEAMTCLDMTCADIGGDCETIYCSDETVNVDTVDGDEYCSADGIPEAAEADAEYLNESSN